MNPEQVAVGRSTLQTMNAEIEDLKRRVKVLEGGVEIPLEDRTRKELTAEAKKHNIRISGLSNKEIAIEIQKAESDASQE